MLSAGKLIKVIIFQIVSVLIFTTELREAYVSLFMSIMLMLFFNSVS